SHCAFTICSPLRCVTCAWAGTARAKAIAESTIFISTSLSTMVPEAFSAALTCIKPGGSGVSVTIRAVLEAADLQCARGGRMLFRGLSFGLQSGELLRVAGANGRGKTSLLRILCGLLTPLAGEVRWKGAPIGPLKEEYSAQLVYLGHAPALKHDLTAAENLLVTWLLAGK